MEVVDHSHIRCISVNQSYLNLTGLQEEQLIGKTIWEILPYEAAAFAFSKYQEVLKTKSIVRYEEKVQLVGGEIIAETRLHPICNEKGQVTHLLGVSQDVTETVKARLALAESEQYLRQSHQRIQRLLETANIGTALMDFKEGRILETDAILQQMLGYTDEELRNQSFSAITYPDDNQPNIVLYQELIGGIRDHYQMEKRYIRKDGSVMWGNLTVTILDRNPLSIMAMVQDVTDRKNMENMLRESEEKYRLIAEKMSDFVSVFDTNEIVTYASPSHCIHLGINLDQYVGSYATPYIHRDDLERVQQTFYQLVQQRCSMVTEFRWKHGDGRWITLEARGEPVMNEKGEVTRVVVVSRDITERKLAEKKLKEANQVLKNLSLRDGLTGIANRRHFDEILEKEGKRAARESLPLSLVLIDIDYFKFYNDTYGHQCGDDCLKNVANIMEYELKRSGDFAARYGGEEFAVILPRTNQQGALHVAERIRSHIETLQIPHIGSKGKPVVTVSIGVATIHPHIFTDVSQLVEWADHALYNAKHKGRNQVCFFSDKLTGNFPIAPRTPQHISEKV